MPSRPLLAVLTWVLALALLGRNDVSFALGAALDPTEEPRARDMGGASSAAERAMLGAAALRATQRSGDSTGNLRRAKLAVRNFRYEYWLAHYEDFPFRPIVVACERATASFCFGPNNGRVPFGMPMRAMPFAFRTSPLVLRRTVEKRVHTALSKLLVALDAAQAYAPGDRWIVGQRFFHLMQNGDLESALEVARACKAEEWWCLLLVASGNYMLARHDSADSALSSAFPSMPADVRCKLTNAEDVLYGDPGAGWYRKLDCGVRYQVNETLWWLADPLYIASGNDRRLEHHHRVLFAQLYSDMMDPFTPEMPIPGYTSFRGEGDKAFFGHGVALPVIRSLGVPAYVVEEVVPVEVDTAVSRNGRLTRIRWELAMPPRQLLQYVQPTYHFVPAVTAIRDPLSATSDAWNLTDGRAWEQYRPRLGVFEQFDSQVGYFRRGDSSRLIAAADVQPTSIARGADLQPVSTGLVLSKSPEDIRVFGISLTASRLWFDGIVPAESSLVSMELLVTGRGAGRARFASGPPSMPAQRVTLSDMIFIDAAGALPENLDEASLRILPRTSIRQGNPLGVFWELYGLAAGDSVSFELIAESIGGSSLFSRLGRLVRLDGGAEGTRVRWTEVAAAEGIAAHAIALDLSQLSTRRYELRLEARVPGQRPVVVSKVVDVERR